MMKNIFMLSFMSFLLFSCKTQKADATYDIGGSWELNYISGPRITFNGLYPNKKPTIYFDLNENRVSGNNSCNSFNGKLVLTGNKIDFTQPMAVTKMMCMDGEGQGEQVFMNTLQKITSYSITDGGKTLNFISGDIAMMRFTKK